MEDNKKKKFLETYEYKLKKVRDAYLQDKDKNTGLDNDYLLIGLFEFLIIVFVGLLLYILEFSAIGYVVSFIALTILVCIYSYFSLKLINSRGRYLYALKKRGYKSIEEYEVYLNKYITGQNGYYSKVLEKLKEEYNITDKTAIIKDINDVEYNIFLEDGCLKLLSLSTEIHPKVKIYALENIRYYREDKDNNYVVLKTNIEEYRFDKKSITTLKYLLPKKDFNVVKNYHPEDYINDFEIYMHAFRNKIDAKNEHYKDLFINSLLFLISFIFIYFGLCVLASVLTKYALFTKIATIIVVYLLFTRFKKSIRYRVLMYNEKDIIYEINNDQNAINHFYELKTALKIEDSYDRVLSTGGYPYAVWIKNDYFHLFLDVAYYNAVYVVVGMKNEIKYKVKGNETVLKLKNKVFHFDKDASKVFKKLLDNEKNK